MIDFLTENILLVAIVLSSGLMLLWPMIQKKSQGPTLTNDQAIELINKKNAFVLDVRTPKEFKRGAIGNSVNIPFEELEKRFERVPQDRPVICVDTQMTFSVKASALLRQKGYKDVHVLADGINGWLAAKLPFSR